MNAETIPPLLAAERRGWTIATDMKPGPEQKWLVLAAPDEAGEAFLAAARIARRFGAGVEVRLGRDAPENSPFATLAQSARLQGMVVDGTAHSEKSVLVVSEDGNELTIAYPPPADAAWRTPLADAFPLVRPLEESPDAVSCIESREIDRRAGEIYGVPGLCLMENAAVAAAAVARDMLERASAGGPVLVVAGGGNNGGDGLALARGLDRAGIAAEVAMLKDPATLSGDAAVNYRLTREAPRIAVHDLHNNPERLAAALGRCALVVDALLGTGFAGRLSPVYRLAVPTVNAANKPVLALDLPSGLDGDSGEAAEEAIRAERTITFAAAKRGLLLAEGPAHCGRLYLGDIGAPREAYGFR